MNQFLREARSWFFALLILAPAAIPYATHLLYWKAFSIPTGYIQPDMPVYMAKARAYFDDGQIHLFYGNPSGESRSEPRIYHQPWTFLLGLIHHISGVRPRTLFVAFWFVAAWCCCRIILALYRECVGLDSRSQRIGLMLFAWGGGLLALAGLLARRQPSWAEIFRFDPFQGWWFLNLGRNLVYPTEALYHLLTFACVLQVMRRKSVNALILAATTAACSPFAGLELLASLVLWSLAELLFVPGRAHSARLFLGASALSAVFVLYYGFYLNSFPEHAQLARQMSLPWTVPVSSTILAGIFVVPLAIARFYHDPAWFSDLRNRLLLCWATTAFALSHHDWVLAPRQPIHFTRGYAWSAPFLLGGPVVVDLLNWLISRRLWWLLGLSIALFLSDNTLWLARFIAEMRVPDQNGMRISPDGEAVLRWLDRPDSRGALVVSEDERIGYLAIAETPARSWVGHPLETPNYPSRLAEQIALFRNGRFLDSWENRPLRIVRYHRAAEQVRPSWLTRHDAVKVLENATFQIYRIDPRAP